VNPLKLVQCALRRVLKSGRSGFTKNGKLEGKEKSPVLTKERLEARTRIVLRTRGNTTSCVAKRKAAEKRVKKQVSEQPWGGLNAEKKTEGF
jgi:hypothetical protein